MRKVFYLILSSVFMISCDFTDDKLKVINNADYDIYTIVNFPTTYYYSFEPNELISSKDTSSIILVNEFWSRVIFEVKTITVYFVIPDSLFKYNRNNWREHVHPLKKLVLSEAQLDSLNWIIVFP